MPARLAQVALALNPMLYVAVFVLSYQIVSEIDRKNDPASTGKSAPIDTLNRATHHT